MKLGLHARPLKNLRFPCSLRFGSSWGSFLDRSAAVLQRDDLHRYRTGSQFYQASRDETWDDAPLYEIQQLEWLILIINVVSTTWDIGLCHEIFYKVIVRLLQNIMCHLFVAPVFGKAKFPYLQEEIRLEVIVRKETHFPVDMSRKDMLAMNATTVSEFSFCRTA